MQRFERLASWLGVENAIILAPMAGGTSTPALVAAVSNAGGLGSMGAGYMTPQQIAETVAEIRSLTNRPFAVNLFAGGPDGTGSRESNRTLVMMAAPKSPPSPSAPQ